MASAACALALSATIATRLNTNFLITSPLKKARETTPLARIYRFGLTGSSDPIGSGLSKGQPGMTTIPLLLEYKATLL
jgi:hypothetical protein